MSDLAEHVVLEPLAGHQDVVHVVGQLLERQPPPLPAPLEAAEAPSVLNPGHRAAGLAMADVMVPSSKACKKGAGEFSLKFKFFQIFQKKTTRYRGYFRLGFFDTPASNNLKLYSRYLD